MGYAIPLVLFKTADTGMAVYRDSACTIKETYNTEEASNPYYELKISNTRRGTEKLTTRYLKNIGVNTTLYYIYVSNEDNITYYFKDSEGNKKTTLMGVCAPGVVKELDLVIEPQFEDFDASFQIHVLTRDLSSS